MSLCCLVPAESAPRGDKLSASVTKGKKNKEGKESRSNKVQSGSRPSSQVNLLRSKKGKLVQSPALMNLKLTRFVLFVLLFFKQQQFDASKPNWTLRVVSEASAVSLMFFLCALGKLI